jgi:hypothetical protein
MCAVTIAKGNYTTQLLMNRQRPWGSMRPLAWALPVCQLKLLQKNQIEQTDKHAEEGTK